MMSRKPSPYKKPDPEGRAFVLRTGFLGALIGLVSRAD